VCCLREVGCGDAAGSRLGDCDSGKGGRLIWIERFYGESDAMISLANRAERETQYITLKE